MAATIPLGITKASRPLTICFSVIVFHKVVQNCFKEPSSGIMPSDRGKELQDQSLLRAETRSAVRKGLGALRRAGSIPIHVYGQGMGSLNLQASAPELLQALAVVGRTVPFNLQVADNQHFVITREIQRHPVTDTILHVDFLRVSRTERMRVEVPLELQGEAPALRLGTVNLVQDLHSIEVEALPQDVPASLSVSLEVLDELDKAIHVGDIELPPRVDLITDPSALVARVVQQRAAAEVEPEFEVEGGPTEAPAQADAAAQDAPQPTEGEEA